MAQIVAVSVPQEVQQQKVVLSCLGTEPGTTAYHLAVQAPHLCRTEYHNAVHRGTIPSFCQQHRIAEHIVSKIPFMHRELAETKITGIEITDSDIGSWYSRRTGKICLSKKVYPDTAIHEYAHAQSDAVGAYDDPRFRAVLRKGLENISPADVIYDEKNILLDSMLDYFSEGYEEYIRNPDNLMLHDPDLFVYFEGII